MCVYTSMHLRVHVCVCKYVSVSMCVCMNREPCTHLWPCSFSRRVCIRSCTQPTHRGSLHEARVDGRARQLACRMAHGAAINRLRISYLTVQRMVVGQQHCALGLGQLPALGFQHALLQSRPRLVVLWQRERCVQQMEWDGNFPPLLALLRLSVGYRGVCVWCGARKGSGGREEGWRAKRPINFGLQNLVLPPADTSRWLVPPGPPH